MSRHESMPQNSAHLLNTLAHSPFVERNELAAFAGAASEQRAGVASEAGGPRACGPRAAHALEHIEGEALVPDAGRNYAAC